MARPSFRALFAGRRLKCAYVGSGLQLFVAGALPAWLPTYFVRYYDLPLKEAASLAGLFLAMGGVGMVICGMISDRVVRGTSRRAMLSRTVLRRLRTAARGCPLASAPAFPNSYCLVQRCSLPRPRPGRPERWSRT